MTTHGPFVPGTAYNVQLSCGCVVDRRPETYDEIAIGAPTDCPDHGPGRIHAWRPA